jgi:hypothetical protein
MQLTPEQVSNNWETLLKIIDTYITGERKDKLKALYEDLSEKIVLAPASGKAHFHNAFQGGYVDHVIRVTRCALKSMNLWREMGAEIDFTEEELVFAALNHDLGKIGDGEETGYIPETSDWHKKNQGSMFKPNPKLPFMLIQDRSLFLLQKYGIPVNHKEYLAIRLHDGIYDDANKAYFFSHNPDSKFRTNIVYILHQGDFLASKIEYDQWKTSK